MLHTEHTLNVCILSNEYDWYILSLTHTWKHNFTNHIILSNSKELILFWYFVHNQWTDSCGQYYSDYWSLRSGTKGQGLRESLVHTCFWALLLCTCAYNKCMKMEEWNHCSLDIIFFSSLLLLHCTRYYIQSIIIYTVCEMYAFSSKYSLKFFKSDFCLQKSRFSTNSTIICGLRIVSPLFLMVWESVAHTSQQRDATQIWVHRVLPSR